jgi:hypothetical protein
LTAETVEGLGFIRDQYRVKGKSNVLLVWRILKTVRGYSVLTVRQLYYILISRFKYPATGAFYKRMNRYLSKTRRANPEVHKKFIDPTRHFVFSPRSYPKIELWVEKDSIRNFIGNLAAKYQLSIQVLRGFASLSMYRKALRRASRRGVSKILYIGDFDPSGLLIEEIAEKEMSIEVVRIVLTLEQVKRFRPPSLSVNSRDSRAKDYIAMYGDKCWEAEALKPRTFLKLVKDKLEESVPNAYLVKAEAWEQAARVSRPITEKLRRMIERKVFRQLKEGKSEEEILAQLAYRYAVWSKTKA